MENITVLISKRANPFELARLEDLLDRFGVVMNIERRHDDTNELTLSYDEKELNTLLTRNAGRRFKEPSHYYTLENIEAMLKERTAKDIAAELGISRSGFFCKLKELRENGDPNSIFA